MLRVAGQTGTVTVLQQTAREHNNPPALIKKQMMIEPTHNSRYSNNNNNTNTTNYTLQITENTDTENKQRHTRKQSKAQRTFICTRICAWENVQIRVTWWGSWQRQKKKKTRADDHRTYWKAFPIFALHLHHASYMYDMKRTQTVKYTHRHTHKYKHNHTHSHVRTHIDTQALMHNM